MRYVESFQSLPIIRHSSHQVILQNNQNQNQAQTSSSSSRSCIAFSTSTAADTMSSSSSSSSLSYLVNPEERDQHYGGNTAQYLVDLHDNKATLNFCGGMMFQFVLSEKLREHLKEVAATTAATTATTTKSTDEEPQQQQQKKQQPMVFDSSHPRMNQIPNYQKTSHVDNMQVFHGREIRQVPDATGGMNFVLQLSYSATDSDTDSDSDSNENENENENDECDPEGWTQEEQERYDGWGQDSGREWRKGEQLVQEGYTTFPTRFGSQAFALHHRFYFHYDTQNRIWLSAEDGCEGYPDATTTPPSSSGVIDGVVKRLSSLMK